VTDDAMTLAIAVYQLTSRFPSQERFGLTAQMRRAAVSIGSHIAEGCGRRRNRELLQFLYIASGSASELAFQLRLAVEIGFGMANDRESVDGHLSRLQRRLNRLTNYLRAQSPEK
jgi:four helix bundle protein